MTSNGIARGNIARQANKKLRRERILDIAKHLIATKGLEAFTLSQLAKEAGVSSPTIHNLFGKKSDIVEMLVAELIENIKGVITQTAPSDLIENSKFIIDIASALYSQNEDFYRAAFKGAEYLGLFNPNMPNGLIQQALKLAEPRQEWYEDGLLLGNIERSIIQKNIHNSQRLGRQDWVNGNIDLKQYRRQVLSGYYMVYAADASPQLHKILCSELEQLSSDQ